MGKLVTKKNRSEKTSPLTAKTQGVLPKQVTGRSRLELTKIKRYYIFDNNQNSDYYQKNRWLTPALLALHTEINSRFGKVVPKIELNSDAELSDWKTLRITIPTKEKFETAQQKLDELIQDWVYYQSPELKRTITLSIV